MTTLESVNCQVEVTFPRAGRSSVQSDLKHEMLTDRSDAERSYWPTDTDLHRLLSDAADPSGEQDSGVAIDRLIALWAEIAVSHAIVRPTYDPAGYVATVVSIEGAWGLGDSQEAALDDLKSVLIGWASLKLEDGDDDIPSMEGVNLVLSR